VKSCECEFIFPCMLGKSKNEISQTFTLFIVFLFVVVLGHHSIPLFSVSWTS
jgi:hypothetical protein